MNTPTPSRAAADDRSPPTRPDRAAVASRLFDTHAPRLLSYLAGRAGRTVADDLLSEVFVVVLRSTGGLTAAEPADEARERAWLFGVATNLLRRHRRDQLRALRATDRLDRAAATLLQHGPEDGVVAGLDARDRLRDFTDELSRLAPADLDLLLLIAWGGLSPTEAAGALGIPAGTARSRLHRIRHTLRHPATTPTTPPGTDHD